MARRRTTEAARAALIEAAITQLDEHLATPHVADAISFLDLHRVCADAGYRGTSMVYSLWRQEAEEAGTTPIDRFGRDVLDHVLSDRMERDRQIIANALESALDQPNWLDVMRVAVNEYMATVENMPLHATARWALTLSADSEVRVQILSALDGDEAADLVSGYDDLIRALGRQWRPGVGPEDFASLARSLSVGILEEQALTDERISMDRTFRGIPGWSTCAIGVVSILEGLTDPADANT